MPWTEDTHDEEGPSPEDLAAFGHEANDDLPEMMCPQCRRMVTEDTQKCPYCGDWITPKDPSSTNWRRYIYVAAVLLMLYAMLRFVF